MNVKSLIHKVVPKRVIIFAQRTLSQCKRIVRRGSLIETDYEYVVFSTKGRHTFFGYYDILPFSEYNDNIIYLKTLDRAHPAEIYVNNLSNTDERLIAKTNAWNWQQGSRLRWFPGSDTKIIFNDFDGEALYSRIVDINSLEEKSLSFPLYDISANGLLGVSLDFNRLGYKRPGYGYTNLPYNDNVNPHDGIEIISIEGNRILKVVTYSEIAEAMGIEEVAYSNWYVNHLSFSPSSNKFLFFFIIDNGKSFTASLLVYDITSESLKVIEKNAKVSHYDWIDNETILCTCYTQSGCQYNIYNEKHKAIDVFNPEQLNSDGHPTCLSMHCLISDTYPDRDSYQSLFQATDTSKRIIAKIFDKKAYSAELRTDLHPRLSRDHKFISVDANTNGKRSMILINVAKDDGAEI